MDKDRVLEFLRGLEKLKGSSVKSEDYKSPLEGENLKVKGGSGDITPAKTKIHGVTQKIDTKGIAPVISGDDFRKKIDSLRAAKAGGKKVLGALPFVGAGMAALSGEPAMAAEELAGDIVPGLEAIKSEDAGMSSSDERMMMAERDAAVNYKDSPAAKDAKLAKLRALMGK